MTEFERPSPAEAQSDSNPTPVDPVLAGLIQICESNPELSIPVTLHVDGATIRGSLTAASAFNAKLEAVLLAGRRAAEVLDETDARMTVGEGIYKLLAKHARGADLGRPPRYAHLVGATQWTPAGSFLLGNLRLRITDISGWALPVADSDS